jgi:hypothetical protein
LSQPYGIALQAFRDDVGPIISALEERTDLTVRSGLRKLRSRGDWREGHLDI